MTRPTIAITMGDPAGIGPEVIMKALALPDTQAICHALVIGDADRLRRAGHVAGVSLAVDALSDAGDANFPSKAVRSNRARSGGATTAIPMPISSIFSPPRAFAA